ncbi:MAG TPA: copper-binding protein [Pyrinomonadaceae bacterium]|jgi:Cu/Ag efflux protein CusF|nr:copper-binding protein [Pyrinomonadaceae bacterium]
MMKILFLTLICLALVGCGDANDRSNQSHPTPSPSPSVTGPAAAVATRGYNGVGTVKALNPKGPSIEIDHGDIEGLMPAMQMEFQVSDATLLNGLQVNDQIDFTIEDRTGVMRVIAIKKK